MNFRIHTDGGARGNPGPAAVGVVIEKFNELVQGWEPVVGFAKKIGETTNNVAEYTGVVEALKYLIDNLKQDIENGEVIKKENKLEFYLDSNLVVNQLNGKFKVNEPHLRNLLLKVKMLEQGMVAKITYQHIPREENSHADHLLNLELDK